MKTGTFARTESTSLTSKTISKRKQKKSSKSTFTQCSMDTADPAVLSF
jgi:hypothetical protein